ncbi:hypothetical protein CC86DRAFT_407799 [Ophiobolus disseminans]|uniref:Uncharacterized protein n=1 Tax=Ophiobolus disseminans TaxID=1469910 RepID=A0A6A6ZUW4_9PLEO|nr:hypothetical protein CC86DRAFT_407799 [Ophiobolus disseminans]
MTPTGKATEALAATAMPSLPLLTTTTSEPEIIDLKTPMAFPPSSEVLVTCSSAIKLEMQPDSHVLISATTPTTPTASTSMTISPSRDFGDVFLRGWKSLPEEIKLHVLSFRLVHDAPISYDDGRYNKMHNDFTLGPELRNHLAMGPDIARIAYEVFFKENIFEIDVRFTAMSQSSRSFRLPQSHDRKLIRRLSIRITNLSDWEFIRKVITGENLFPNVNEVCVLFTWVKAPHVAVVDALHFKPIIVTCKGSIRVVNRRNPHYEQDPRVLEADRVIRRQILFTKSR